MRQELKALNDVCRVPLAFKEDGTEKKRERTLSYCQKCSEEDGFEFVEGNMWVAHSEPQTPTSLPVRSPPALPPAHPVLACFPEYVNFISVNSSNTTISSLGLDDHQHLEDEEDEEEDGEVEDEGEEEDKEDHAASPAFSPFIVQFYDAFPDSGSDGECIVLEYMRWGSLHEILLKGRVFSENEVAVIAYSILQALQTTGSCHYIHRDVKVMKASTSVVRICWNNFRSLYVIDISNECLIF